MDSSWQRADVVRVGVAVAAAAVVGFVVGQRLGRRRARINAEQDTANPNVFHLFDVEDIGDKKSFCRCWRSQKFPFCDGSHHKHNKLTGDNVGPVAVKRSA